MLEAKKTFRRLKAHKQLPVLRAALLRHQQALLGDQPIAKTWQHRVQPTVPAAPIQQAPGLSVSFRPFSVAVYRDLIWRTTKPCAFISGRRTL
jgi:hypothetical protein